MVRPRLAGRCVGSTKVLVMADSGSGGAGSRFVGGSWIVASVTAAPAPDAADGGDDIVASRRPWDAARLGETLMSVELIPYHVSYYM